MSVTSRTFVCLLHRAAARRLPRVGSGVATGAVSQSPVRAFSVLDRISQVGKSRGALTPKQVEQYNKDGYIVIEDFTTAAAVDSIRKRAVEIVQDFAKDSAAKKPSIFSTVEQESNSNEYFMESGDKIRCFFEPDAWNKDGSLKSDTTLSINKIGHAMHELDPVFRKFSNTPEVYDLARSLGYTDPRVVQSMFIFKQPKIGGIVTAHQDSTFLYTDPLSTLGIWYACEDASRTNGCLWALPGSHLLGTKRYFKRDANNKGYFEPKEEEKWPLDKFIPLEVKKGTVVVLHGSLVHLSYENKSAHSRHAYTLHVLEGNLKYPASNWLQRADRGPFMPLTGRG